MPALRTEITEIVTGLAMLGYSDLDHALSVRPHVVHNVTDDHFARLSAARRSGDFDDEFRLAWTNGFTFAAADDGLRGRPPWRLEWKGPHRPPGYEQLPADLRVDHVYLISCKYGSNILHNTSPANLFDRRLAERGGSGADWFAEVAPEAYQAFYDVCRTDLGGDLPGRVSDLDAGHRATLKAGLRSGLSEAASEAYRWLAATVGTMSARRWLEGLDTPARRREMLWRLLRLEAAPYFVLGAAADGTPLHYRLGTPWDFDERFAVRSFDAWGDAVGQPLVRWRADITDKVRGSRRRVEGHVEVRWSHGRFANVPEAKVYLDTAHHDVAGYFPLTGDQP
ncbi:MAG: hypothetical protein RIE08_05450 [Acidimicrobiales bacterium]